MLGIYRSNQRPFSLVFFRPGGKRTQEKRSRCNFKCKKSDDRHHEATRVQRTRRLRVHSVENAANARAILWDTSQGSSYRTVFEVPEKLQKSSLMEARETISEGLSHWSAKVTVKGKDAAREVGHANRLDFFCSYRSPRSCR